MESSTALEFGLINTLRTGHVLFDTLLCLLIPMLLQHLLSVHNHNVAGSLFKKITDFFFAQPKSEFKTRSIELVQRYNHYGKVDDGEQTNHLLQKAVALYLAEALELQNKDARYELLERDSPTQSKDKAEAQQLEDGDLSVPNDSDNLHDTGGCNSSYNQVSKLRVCALPAMNTWISVEDDIEFMHEITDQNDDESPGNNKKLMKESKTIFHFRTLTQDGTQRIDALIERAFNKYQAMERAKMTNDKSRYMYMRTHKQTSSSEEDDSGKGGALAYKRYQLGEDKTFENLFFEGKAQVLQLLDNFVHRTGKFAIKGFPYKLGLLLYGPPGTGKTSLIKAIAQYTKRHIVNVPLSMIKTNEELQDALFDLRFAVDQLDLPVKMHFEDVVFVMEDVDCASSVVNSRGDQGSKKSSTRQESHKSKSKDKNTGSDATPKSAEENLMSSLFGSFDDLCDDTFIGPKKKQSSGSDHLNLSGLLNVLDGVIDSPGRIVIMTTNHPEKLDPALVRPGRVNKKLLLSYMGVQQVVEMIEYYFSTTLGDEEKQRLVQGLSKRGKDGQFSPAEIEEFCAEYDTVEEILCRLERKSRKESFCSSSVSEEEAAEESSESLLIDLNSPTTRE